VSDANGTLALVGGSEWTDGCDFDAELLAASGGKEVLVLPTAAAYEHPERAALAAAEWFSQLGAQVEGLMVLSRRDAEDAGAAAVVRRHRFIYLCGGSSLHLRSVMKSSAVFDALVEAYRSGAVVAGSSAGAMALTDPMVDPRGGALTVGLGLLPGMAVVPHFGDVQEDVHGEKLHRSVALAPDGLPVVGIPERTALVREPDGTWRSSGVGEVAVFVDGARAPAGLGALA
jgi:cyanophycinase